MLRRLKAIYRVIKTDGLYTGVKWLIVTVYHRLIPQKQIVWCTNLMQREDLAEFVLPDHLSFQRYQAMDQIGKEDLRAFLACSSILMGSATFIIMHERFNKGAILWMLKVNGQVAGYWWTIANNHVTPTYLPHTSKDIHAIGIELFEGFRGGRLLKTFSQAVQSTLKKECYQRYYAETYLWNLNAIKAFQRIGDCKVGTATRFGFFGKNVIIWHEMSETLEVE
jgi:hypothetical protein